jgi:hypothetical protein
MKNMHSFSFYNLLKWEYEPASEDPEDGRLLLMTCNRGFGRLVVHNKYQPGCWVLSVACEIPVMVTGRRPYLASRPLIFPGALLSFVLTFQTF